MTLDDTASADILATLDRLVSDEAVESNCLFQLAIMLAQIAVEPCSDAYVEQAEQTMLRLIRSKPKSNVVRLFGAAHARSQPIREPLRLQA